MKKIIAIFLMLIYVNASDFFIITPKSYYVQANIQNAYNKYLVYEKTKKLIEVLNIILHNSKFKNFMYLDELGTINDKINIIDLLKELKVYLEGWPKYSNIDFENNTNLAGIEKIIKDSIDNDSNILDIPKDVINDMYKSILNIKFFEMADKIEYDMAHKNMKKVENVFIVMRKFRLLMDSYENSFSKLNLGLVNFYNPEIKYILIRKYRLYAKTNLKKIIKTFRRNLDQKY